MDHQQKLGMMNEIALKSRQNAYCPYSNFPVGSCALGVDGKFYSGCNVENAIDTVCGQRLSILKMVENGCREIKQLYVVTQNSGEKITPPCGFCRQYIKEFSKNDDLVLVHIGSISKGYQKTFTLAQLFPLPFSPPLKAQLHK